MARIDGTDNDDTLNGSYGDDYIAGRGGNETLNGGAGNDGLSGGTGNNTLNGGAGNDNIWGGADDVIDGGAGNDFISAYGGTDTVTGGSGNDTFKASDKAGTLTITDFTAGDGSVDRIQLNGYGWQNRSYIDADGFLQFENVPIARDFDELLTVMTQVGDDTHIALTGDYTIILKNVDKNDLIAEYFTDYQERLTARRAMTICMRVGAGAN